MKGCMQWKPVDDWNAFCLQQGSNPLEAEIFSIRNGVSLQNNSNMILQNYFICKIALKHYSVLIPIDYH